MKKLFLAFTLLGAFSSNAQLMKIGIKAGANYANYQSSSLQTDALTSYHAGLLANFKLLKSFSLQPELLYSTQGASYKKLDKEITEKLGYISAPIIAKIGLGKTLSIELGPQFSWLASKKVDTSTELNSLDFGAVGGLSLNLTEKLFLQARYVAGLTEITKNADIKNSVGQLSIGYIF